MSNNNSSIFVIAVAAMFMLCGASAAVIIASSNNDNGFVSDYTLGYNDGVSDATAGYAIKFAPVAIAAAPTNVCLNLESERFTVPEEILVQQYPEENDCLTLGNVMADGSDVIEDTQEITYSEEYIRGYFDGYFSVIENRAVSDVAYEMKTEGVFESTVCENLEGYAY